MEASPSATSCSDCGKKDVALQIGAWPLHKKTLALLLLLLLLAPDAAEQAVGDDGAEGLEDLAAALRGEAAAQEGRAGAGAGVPLCLARAIPYGMGDRFLTILSVAALARALDRRVWVAWHTLPPGVENDRTYDWETVAASVTLPAHVSILSGLNASAALEGCPPTSQIRCQDRGEWGLPSLMGADGIPQLAHFLWRVEGEPHVEEAAYEAAYREVAEEFHVREVDLPRDFPKVFAVLHVRGGDKRAVPGRAFCTDAVLRQLRACGVDVVAVSDDAEMLDGFLARHPWLLTPPHHRPPKVDTAGRKLTKLDVELRDLALLMRGSGILQHSSQGYSAFGVVAAVARNVVLLNTDAHALDEDGWPNKILFLQGFGVLENLLSCAAPGDDHRFLAALDCHQTHSLTD